MVYCTFNDVIVSIWWVNESVNGTAGFFSASSRGWISGGVGGWMDGWMDEWFIVHSMP